MGNNTFKTILEKPNDLLLIPTITKNNVDTLHDKLIEYEKSYEIILYLNEIGFSTKDSMIIYNNYKDKTINAIEDNIYKILQDINEISFKKIDIIALKTGILKDDIKRIKAAIIYIMKELSNNIGHSYYYKEEIFKYLEKYYKHL